jgi:hypothetical protein
MTRRVPLAERRHRSAILLLAFAAALLAPAASRAASPACAGRWDATISLGSNRWPAWFEISGDEAEPAMRLQLPAGAPRPVHPILTADGRLTFFSDGLGGQVEGRFMGDTFEGTVARPGADALVLSAVRAPELPEGPVTWGKPVRLFDGHSLAGWHYRWNRDEGWESSHGALGSVRVNNDLVSNGRYTNFRLHLRYRLQHVQDSGVHLRGRYEIQLTDRPDATGPTDRTGAVYGYEPPLVEAQLPAGKWNTLDVELVGSRLTARLNGQFIHDHVRLAGITGDALDSNEGEPGPIVLQGYLGLVEFRDIVLTPAR